MPLDISAITPTYGEIQRKYLYKMMIEDYPITLNATFPRARMVSQTIDLLNQKGVWPKRSTEDIPFQWSGEKIFFSGGDKSEKTFTLQFAVDQRMDLLDFFEALKDLTGNLGNHAAMNKPFQTLIIGVYMVDVGKKTVTDYRGLGDARISGIEFDELDKTNNNSFSLLTVSGTWDRTIKDTSKRGKTI